MFKIEIDFWFFKEEELLNVVTEVQSKIGFVIDNHDWENSWEWIECYQNEKEIKLNISRRHKDGKGCFEYPIMFRVGRDNGNFTENDIVRIGNGLRNTLHTEINFGNIKYLNGNDYEYELIKKF